MQLRHSIKFQISSVGFIKLILFVFCVGFLGLFAMDKSSNVLAVTKFTTPPGTNTGSTIWQTIGTDVTVAGTINISANGLVYPTLGQIIRPYQNGSGQNFWSLQSGSSSGSGIRFLNSDLTTAGYVFNSAASGFGLVDSAGNWKVQVSPSTLNLTAGTVNLGASGGTTIVTGKVGIGKTPDPGMVLDVLGAIQAGSTVFAGNVQVPSYLYALGVGFGSPSGLGVTGAGPVVQGANAGVLEQYNGPSGGSYLTSNEYRMYYGTGGWSYARGGSMYVNASGLSLLNNVGNAALTVPLWGTNVNVVGNLSFSAANPYITASSYFVAPGGAYFNSGLVYTEGEMRIRGGMANDSGNAGGDISINDSLRIASSITCLGGYCPPNNVARLTPNLHLNSNQNYAIIVNWDNGAVSATTQEFRVGNGQGADAFYVRADGNFYGSAFIDQNNSGYYMDPNSTSRTAYTISDTLYNYGDFTNVGNFFGHEVYSNSYFRVQGAGGIYWQDYGGGWIMNDTWAVRTYGGKAIYTAAETYAAGGFRTPNLQFGNNNNGWTDRGCTGCADSINGNPNMWITAQSQIYMRSPNYNLNDVAELFPSSDKLESGDIVSTSNQDKHVQKNNPGSGNKVLGIVSTNPAILIDGTGLVIGGKSDPNSVNTTTDPKEKQALIDMYQKNQNKYPVTLSGRVPVKVTTAGGNISYGDSITSSTLPGVGMKATNVSETVGKAMTEFKPDDSKCSAVNSLQAIQWPALQNTDDQEGLEKSCFKLPDGTFVGKVMVFTNTSTYDPDTYLTSTDGSTITEVLNGKYQVKDAQGNIVTKIGQFAETVIGNLKAGAIQAQKVVINGVDVIDRLNQQQQEIDQLKQEVQELKNKP